MELIRNFVPGSAWLYCKIYTGITTADIILGEVIQPLVNDLKTGRHIQKWFFIRYGDPKNHLRLRFELSDSNESNEVLALIHNALEPYINSGEVSNIVFETYQREIERYGEKTMEPAEELFYKNSEFTLSCLAFDDEDKIITTLFYIDQLLNSLDLPVSEKLMWIKESNESFKKEFNGDKHLNAQLDRKYRLFRAKYAEFLESDDYKEFRDTVTLHIEECEEILEKINQLHEGSVRNFFQSIFHMNINRLFGSSQRLFEMIVYDYLHRYYKTLFFHKNKA